MLPEAVKTSMFMKDHRKSLQAWSERLIHHSTLLASLHHLSRLELESLVEADFAWAWEDAIAFAGMGDARLEDSSRTDVHAFPQALHVFLNYV